ncbi:MAG: alpha/beta hydrolase [Alphaproteobacteria bacterium]|nr:alpha/beta hydrolase [Alphaproteobacteria bacterium]
MAEVIFQGPEGRLEGRYHHNPDKHSPIAVVLHPHPLYGGTMNNKIVYRLYSSFARAGFSVLRFNFRGVGRSVGKFDDGIGELTDAATALDWVQLQNPDASSCWIAGFSFGAWISLQLLMRRPEIEGFLAISPPANMYDFGFLSPCPASGLITQGDRDDIVSEPAVAQLVEKLRAQKGTKVDYKVINGADHYYRNNMDQLYELVDQYVLTKTEEFKARPRLRPDRKRRNLPLDNLIKAINEA